MKRSSLQGKEGLARELGARQRGCTEVAISAFTRSSAVPRESLRKETHGWKSSELKTIVSTPA